MGKPEDRMPVRELVKQVRVNGASLQKTDPQLWKVVEHLLDALDEGRQ